MIGKIIEDKEVGKMWCEMYAPHWNVQELGGARAKILALICKLVEMALGASFGYTPPSHPQYKARLMIVLEQFGIDPTSFPHPG